jgi:hypothetical protein
MLKHRLSWAPLAMGKKDHHGQGHVQTEEISYRVLRELREESLNGARGATMRDGEKVQSRAARLA